MPSAAASSSNHRPHDLGHPTRSRPGVSPASAGAAFYHVQFQGIGIPAITSTIRRPNRRARRCAVRVACSPPGVVGFRRCWVACSPPGVVGFRRCWFGCVVGGFGWCRVWDEVADAFGEVLGASGYAVLVSHGGLWADGLAATTDAQDEMLEVDVPALQGADCADARSVAEHGDVDRVGVSDGHVVVDGLDLAGMLSWMALTWSTVAGTVSISRFCPGVGIMQGLAGMRALSPFLPGVLAVASTALRTLSALTHMARWERSNWMRALSPFLPGVLAVASTALRTLSALTHMARWERSNWSSHQPSRIASPPHPPCVVHAWSCVVEVWYGATSASTVRFPSLVGPGFGFGPRLVATVVHGGVCVVHAWSCVVEVWYGATSASTVRFPSLVGPGFGFGPRLVATVVHGGVWWRTVGGYHIFYHFNYVIIRRVMASYAYHGFRVSAGARSWNRWGL